MTNRRALLGGAAILGSLGFARAAWSRWEAVAAVPHDMRSWQLYLPLEFSSTLMLRLLRLLPPPDPADAIVPGVDVDKRSAPGPDGQGPVEVYVYDTPGRQRPAGALLWIHGGGYVAGDPITSHRVCSGIAGQLGIVVINVGYRLAPEHPFPAGLDDCYAALRWLHERADDLGVDVGRIAVGGESAGGGLAAALAQLAYDRAEVPVCLQLLVYPMLDDRTVLDQTRPKTLVWSPTSNRFGWTAYLGHPPRLREDRPYAVPARRDDLNGLPPAWIGVGDLDLFHDEDVAYAERLQAAGVDCQVEVVSGMYHGAYGMAPLDSPTVNAFRVSAVQALDRALNDQG